MKTVFLVGPTACGKSALALELAEKFGGVILNADSVQVYRELLIGAASPSPEDLQRVPHVLFQTVSAPDRITAGDYSRLALKELEKLAKQNVPVVFITGGTGFYLMALEKGMLPIEKADPVRQDALEVRLKLEGAEALHAELVKFDPLVGARISAADHYRLVRALEIIARTGRPLSEIEAEHHVQPSVFPYEKLKLGITIDRQILRERITQRTRQMLGQGLIEEVKGLLKQDLSHWEPLQSVGYKETLAYLARDAEVASLLALEEKIIQNTMRLAKKQKTWFQRDPEIQWGDFSDATFFGQTVRRFLDHPLSK